MKAVQGAEQVQDFKAGFSSEVSVVRSYRGVVLRILCAFVLGE